MNWLKVIVVVILGFFPHCVMSGWRNPIVGCPPPTIWHDGHYERMLCTGAAIIDNAPADLSPELSKIVPDVSKYKELIHYWNITVTRNEVGTSLFKIRIAPNVFTHAEDTSAVIIITESPIGLGQRRIRRRLLSSHNAKQSVIKFACPDVSSDAPYSQYSPCEMETVYSGTLPSGSAGLVISIGVYSDPNTGAPLLFSLDTHLPPLDPLVHMGYDRSLGALPVFKADMIVEAGPDSAVSFAMVLVSAVVGSAVIAISGAKIRSGGAVIITKERLIMAIALVWGALIASNIYALCALSFGGYGSLMNGRTGMFICQAIGEGIILSTCSMWTTLVSRKKIFGGKLRAWLIATIGVILGAVYLAFRLVDSFINRENSVTQGYAITAAAVAGVSGLLALATAILHVVAELKSEKDKCVSAVSYTQCFLAACVCFALVYSPIAQDTSFYPVAVPGALSLVVVILECVYEMTGNKE